MGALHQKRLFHNQLGFDPAGSPGRCSCPAVPGAGTQSHLPRPLLIPCVGLCCSPALAGRETEALLRWSAQLCYINHIFFLEHISQMLRGVQRLIAMLQIVRLAPVTLPPRSPPSPRPRWQGTPTYPAPPRRHGSASVLSWFSFNSHTVSFSKILQSTFRIQ